jgi:hypothetical protein
VLYPPSDICSVNVGAGTGCGQPHVRPTGPDGRPVHPWGFSCSGGCEEHLVATDSRFVRTVAEIEPTFDERKEQEQYAVRAGADRDALMLQALSRLAGLEMPSSLTRPLPGATPVAAMLACPNPACGSAQPAGHSFCAACGSPMRTTVPAGELPARAS